MDEAKNGKSCGICGFIGRHQIIRVLLWVLAGLAIFAAGVGVGANIGYGHMDRGFFGKTFQKQGAYGFQMMRGGQGCAMMQGNQGCCGGQTGCAMLRSNQGGCGGTQVEQGCAMMGKTENCCGAMACEQGCGKNINPTLNVTTTP